MNSIIQKHVMPLVGTMKWDGFDKTRFGNLISLQNKLIKHTTSRNIDKLCNYLAFCIQQWPVFAECPIDRIVIDNAIKTIRECKQIEK